MPKLGLRYADIPRDVKITIWAIAISWFFWGPADAYFSLYLKEFGSSYSQIGWLVSLGKLIPIFIAIPIGILADRFSSRKILLWSLFLYLSVPVLYFYAGTFSLIIILIVAILVNSILRLIRDVGIQTYIKEKTPAKLSVKVWSSHEAITMGFWGLGMIGGGLLVAHFSLSQLFLFVLVGILTQILMFLRTSEPVKNFQKRHLQVHRLSLRARILRGVRHLWIVDQKVRYMLLVTFLSGLTVGSVDVFLVLFAVELDFGIASIGILMGAIYSSFFLAIPMNRITRKIGRFHSMYVGQFIMALTMVAVFFFSESVWWILFIAFFSHWAAFMLVKPVCNGIIAAYTPPDMQGEMSGIQIFVLTLANFLGAIIFGYVGEIFGLKWIFGVIGVIYFVMAVVFVWLMLRYEHTVKHVKVHPHQSDLTMLHHTQLKPAKK